jgi:ACS family pantothenate transporter-like MFS transporter
MGRPVELLGSYGRETEVGPDGSQEQLVVKPIKSWKGYVWDTWDLPRDQRWLLFRVDAFVLTFASVSF